MDGPKEIGRIPKRGEDNEEVTWTQQQTRVANNRIAGAGTGQRSCASGRACGIGFATCLAHFSNEANQSIGYFAVQPLYTYDGPEYNDYAVDHGS